MCSVDRDSFREGIRVPTFFTAVMPEDHRKSSLKPPDSIKNFSPDFWGSRWGSRKKIWGIFAKYSMIVKIPANLVISRLVGIFLGGDKRDRTADLLNAIQALSQLSYTPKLSPSPAERVVLYQQFLQLSSTFCKKFSNCRKKEPFHTKAHNPALSRGGTADPRKLCRTPRKASPTEQIVSNPPADYMY